MENGLSANGATVSFAKNIMRALAVRTMNEKIVMTYLTYLVSKYYLHSLFVLSCFVEWIFLISELRVCVHQPSFRSYTEFEAIDYYLGVHQKFISKPKTKIGFFKN